MTDEIVKRYGERVGYTEADIEKLHEEGHRIRHLKRMAKAAPLYSIEAEVISEQMEEPIKREETTSVFE